jgi:RNA polymerase sigma factor (sigma-70 family)
MTQLLEKTEATEATATLFNRHYGRIRAYCLGQLRDSEEANDAAQSTFLYAFAALQRGVAPRNELPWLFTIAHNVCRTRRRSLRRRSRLESGVDLDSLSEIVGRDDTPRDDLDRLGTSLAALPENQRKALLLREWRGLSYAEVAERMGLTESAVEAVLFRARRSLAQKLRAVDRAASLVGATLFIPGLRRLGSLTGTAKAAAATLAVGVVAGTAIEPLVHPPRRTSVTLGHAGRTHQAASLLGASGTTAETRHGGRAPHPSKTPVVAARYARPRTAAPTAEPQTGSGPQAPGPNSETATFEPPRTPHGGATADADAQATAAADSRAAGRPSTPDPGQNVVADVPPGRPDTSDVSRLLPPQVQDLLQDVPVPNPSVASGTETPSLRSLVTDLPDGLPNVALPNPAVETAPEVPSVPTATAPSLPTSALPDDPTQGTPLQASP